MEYKITVFFFDYIVIIISYLPKVAAATKEEWPGNEISTIRKNKDNTRQLDELVKKLAPKCKLPKNNISLHIMDYLTRLDWTGLLWTLSKLTIYNYTSISAIVLDILNQHSES